MSMPIPDLPRVPTTRSSRTMPSWTSTATASQSSGCVATRVRTGSEIEVYKNAVGYHSYISPGQVDEAYSVLKNSRVVSSADMNMKFDIFSDEQEVEYEGYSVNGKEVDEDTYNEFVQKLGDIVEVTPEWILIE